MPDVYEVPDYELAPTFHLTTPESVKAVIEPTRGQILDLVLERAATVTELAAALDRPKSSVAHHVDVLVDNGLLRVVRTRQVRAIEERFYGRTGRTIVFGPEMRKAGGVRRSSFLVEALAEAPDGPELLSTLRHARIPKSRAKEFFREVDRLAQRFTALERGGETVYGFVGAVYPTDHPVLASPDPGALDG